MADLATLQTRLTEAEAALHTLNTTGGTVEVRVADDRVTYGQNNIPALERYIASLKSQIAQIDTTATGAKRRRALRPYTGA